MCGLQSFPVYKQTTCAFYFHAMMALFTPLIIFLVSRLCINAFFSKNNDSIDGFMHKVRVYDLMNKRSHASADTPTNEGEKYAFF